MDKLVFEFSDGRKFIFGEYRGESQLIEEMRNLHIYVKDEDFTYDELDEGYKQIIKFSDFREKMRDIKNKKMMWELSDLEIESDYNSDNKIFKYLGIKETEEEKTLKKKLYENYYRKDNKYMLGNKYPKKPEIFFDYYFFERNDEGFKWEYAANLATNYGTYEIWKWFYDECDNENDRLTQLYSFLMFSNGDNIKYLINEHIIDIENAYLNNKFLRKLKINSFSRIIEVMLRKSLMVNDIKKIYYIFQNICELSEREILENKERDGLIEKYILNLNNLMGKHNIDVFVESIVDYYMSIVGIYDKGKDENITDEMIKIFDWIYDNCNEKIPRNNGILGKFLYKREKTFNWLFDKGYYHRVEKMKIREMCVDLIGRNQIHSYSIRKIYENGLYDFKIPYEMMMKIEDEEIIKFLCEKNPGHCRSYKFMYGEYRDMDLYDKYLE